MTDNYCDYSCLFPLTEEDEEKAFTICDGITDAIDDRGLGLTNWEVSSTGIWFNSDHGSGEPQAVIEMVRALLLEFTYVDGFCFSWSFTCSKLRLDEFGGGAWAGRVVDGVIEEIYIDAYGEADFWLKEKPEVPENSIRKIRVEDS
jgi:hypothetical protein